MSERMKLPKIGDELYERYPFMSAQTHEAEVKRYAKSCLELMRAEQASVVTALQEEVGRLRTAIGKVNAIRNSIIGCQKMNWSEHIYPLVAALNEAGIEGQDYPEAREYVGTMLERTLAAEARANAAEQRLTEAVRLIESLAPPEQSKSWLTLPQYAAARAFIKEAGE